MKLSHLAYAAVGYTLGARAGRERYESIVRVARRVAGSQTVQSTAGVVHAQLDILAARARQSVAAGVSGRPPQRPGSGTGAQGGQPGVHRS